jgi:hypothetical protein
MQDFKKLIELLKDGIVTFKYTKSDGEERVANGTLNKKIISHFKGDDGYEKEPSEFRIEKQAIDTIVAMKYSSIEEYLSANKINLIGEENGEYIFSHKPRKTNENNISYFDIDKKEFRSFLKNRFIEIISSKELVEVEL